MKSMSNSECCTSPYKYGCSGLTAYKMCAANPGITQITLQSININYNTQKHKTICHYERNTSGHNILLLINLVANRQHEKVTVLKEITKMSEPKMT